MITIKEIPRGIGGLSDKQIIDTWRGISLTNKAKVLDMLKWDGQYPIDTKMMYNGLLHLGYGNRVEVITK